MSDSSQSCELQHVRLPWPSLSPGICSDSCPLSRWCYITFSSTVPPACFAFNLPQHQGLFQWVSCLHQVAKVIGASVSAAVLPMNIQSWFPLGLTHLIPLQFKELSRVFSLKMGPNLTKSEKDNWRKIEIDCLLQ